MPPLENVKHEKFARAVLEKPSFSQAYASVYKTVDPKVSSNAGSRLLENVGIRNRISELMNQKGLGLDPILERLGKWIYDDEHASVSLDATKTGLKLHGVLDGDEKENMNNIHINIVNLSDTNNT